MPFSARVVDTREDIPEVFQGNAVKVLEKANVSNMIGLLEQLNSVSKYASEVFSDILKDTEKNSMRIKECKSRIQRIDTKVQPIEKMFVERAPSYFYDNPYTGKEWKRRDALKGLIFRRDRSIMEVNRRRNEADPPPNLSALDQYSKQPCIKKFTDSNFFMNEWMEAEKKKIEEERAKRAARKRRKKKKRDQKKTIKKIAVKKFDPNTGKMIISTDTEVAVKQYTFIDEVGGEVVVDDDKKESLNSKKSIAQSSNSQVSAPMDKAPNVQQQTSAAARGGPRARGGTVVRGRGRGGPRGRGRGRGRGIPSGPGAPPDVNQPPANPVASNPPPNPVAAGPGGAPPPNPVAQNGPPVFAPSGGPPAFNPSGPPAFNPGNSGPPANPLNGINENEQIGAQQPPANPYANESQAQPPPLDPMQRAMLSAKMAENSGMMKQAAPPKPKMPGMKSGMLLNAIRKGKTLKKAAPVVKRKEPQDKRSMLMAQLRGGKKLKNTSRKIGVPPVKKEEPKDQGIFAILNRRQYVADDDSDDSDESSGWSTD